MKSLLILLSLLVSILSGIGLSQTATDLNEGVKFTSGPALGTYQFSWWGRLGKSYLLQESEDLTSWQYLPMIEVGGNAPLSYGFTSNADKFFLRLQISTEPFNADSDGNGVFDGYQALNAIVPNSGGLTYLQQYLQGLAPAANGGPDRLPDGGNTWLSPNYDTANPGGGGAGPQTDSSHDGYSSTPYPPSLSVSSQTHTDANGSTIYDYDKTHLTWYAPSVSVQSYTIQRRDSTGSWTTIGTAASSATEYDDNSGLLANIHYSYRLVVKFGSGQTLISSGAEYGVPLFKGMSIRTSSKARYNPGYPEFIASTPPKYYLTDTKTASYNDSYSDSYGGSSSTKSYNQTTTLSPNEGTYGTYTYAGSSNSSYNSWSSDGSNSGSIYTSTQNADGSWTGTYSSWSTDSQGNYSSNNGAYNYPPFSGFYYYNSTSTTATNRTYSFSDANASGSNSETLSNEYTSATFFSDTISQLPTYGDWQDNYYYWGYYGSYYWGYSGYYGYTGYQYGWWSAYRSRNSNNSYLSLSKAKYKFQTSASAPITVKFYDVFQEDTNYTVSPAVVPSPQVIGSHTFAAGPSVTESAEYEVDPSATPDAFIPNGKTGHYYMVFGAQLGISGSVANSNGGFDYSSYFDDTEKSSGLATLSPAGTNGSNAVTGSVYLPNYGLAGATYTVSFTGGSAFTVTDSYGHTISNGQQITQAQLNAGTFSSYLTITANASANDGQQITISLSANDATGNSFGTDSATFTTRSSVNQDYTIPLDEASGSRYRKIGLNGRPLPDEKPQQTTESDQEKEETYIDALTLGLRHSTTDVYVPVPGSDMTISARRDTLSEVWNMRSGLRPHERFDRPFGAGWSSNICVTLEYFYSSDGTTYYYITDQNGARHRFVESYDAINYGYHYVPLPSDSRENGDYLTSFDGGTFTDRYGTKITFNYSATTYQYLTSDRNGNSGYEQHYYYGADQIVDRNGNTLTYSYPDPATVKTLIPSTITLAGSPYQTLSIEQDTSGHITKIWDPSGNQFTYGYTDRTYSFNGQNFAAKTLTSVTGPDGKVTQYAYNFQEETDLTPADLNNGEPTNKLHLDVSSITDPNLNTTSFGYSFDQTRWNYSTKVGYFRQTGSPRNVTSVTLPGGLGSTTLVNNSKVALNPASTVNGSLTLTSDSQRRIQVTDAGANSITYRFGEGAGNSQVFNVGGFYPNTPPAAIPKIVFYKTMQIDYTGGYEKFTFDPAAGLALASVRDFSGNTTSYVYGDSYTPEASALYPTIFPVSGMLTKYADPTSQTDALGHTKTFTYGSWRIMNSVTDEEGRTRTYQVDSQGRRKNEVIYTSNASSAVLQTTEYAYENTAFPGVATKTTVKKLSGPAWSVDLITQYDLDTNGRVWKEIVNPGGLALTTTTTYDRNGNKLTVTDPNGNATRFQYDKRNRLLKVVYADGFAKSIDYYPNGNKWHETDENNHTTTFTYDALNRPKTQTRMVTMGGVLTPLVTQFGYENAVKPKTSAIDSRGYETTMQYDGLLRLVSTTDALLQTTTLDYSGANAGAHVFNSTGFQPTRITDSRGYKTEVTYDALYRPTVKKSDYQLSPALFAKTEIDYDNVGNATISRDALNHATTTQFDALNRPYHVTFADNKDVWTYYTPTGLKWKVKDELGYESETQSDAAGRPVLSLSPSVDNGSGTFQPAQTQTIYQGTNVAATINPLGKRWDYFYDVRNRKIQEIQPSVVNAATGASVRPNLYTGYDYVGNVLWMQDARGYTTETSYDEANRPISVTAPPILTYGLTVPTRPTSTTSYDKNGNVLTATDPNGHTTTNTYNALNRLKTTKDAANITVTYDYDAAGNRKSVKDGLNQETILAFDGLNRNTRITDATGKFTSFFYDGQNKTSRTDAKSQITNYGYDLRNRLTSITYPSRTQDNRTYGYDFAGSLLTVTEPSKSGSADVGYTYDALRRVATETSNGATHTYRYDLAGNRLSVQYGLVSGGNGRLVTSTYDALNRLSTLSEGTRNTSYGYDLNGNLLTKTLPNGEVVSQTYDGLNRLFAEKGISPQGPLYNHLSLCDAVGNLRFSSEMSASVPTRSMVLDYDNTNRLTNERVYSSNNQLTSTTVHGYDNANNRTSKTVGGVVTSYTYNTLNQLTGWSDTTGATASYGYDFNGNRSSRTLAGVADSYSYDLENRLTSLTKNTTNGAGTYGYVYDYRTRRVARTENATTTTVVFSGGTSVQEYVSNSLTAEYIRGSDWGGGVGGILYSLRSGTPSFAHYNRRGDVTTRTDATGVLTYQASYQADGKRTQEFGATQDRQKANTKEEDPTGLINEGMRLRDLETLTFITADPAGFVDGPNLYTYVRCNPWTAFDPLGLDDEKTRHDAFHFSLEQRELGMALGEMFGQKTSNEQYQSAVSGASTDAQHTVDWANTPSSEKASILASMVVPVVRPLAQTMGALSEGDADAAKLYGTQAVGEGVLAWMGGKMATGSPTLSAATAKLESSIVVESLIQKTVAVGEDMTSAQGLTVWRNVPAGHGAIGDAQNGLVKPFGTIVDQSFSDRVLAHDTGFTQGTGLTSWTSDLGWAQTRQARLGGILLQTKAPTGSVWFNQAAKGAESQVLIPGEINATILQP